MARQIPKTMKAGQYDPKQGKVVVNEIPVPVPGKNEMLVKIKSASLCHSDFLAMEQTKDEPVTIGHEGCGHIVAFDPSAEGKGFSVGDAVGFLCFRGCCYNCRGCSIHFTHCETGGQRLQGWPGTDGFFAEYAIVDYHAAIKLDESVWDMTRASAVFCAGVTTFHSIDQCDLSPGDWFGVVGCGGLGQMAIQYAKAMGLRVVATDVAVANLAEAKSQGADAVFNSMQSGYIDEIKKLTGGGCKAVAVYTNADKAYETAPSLIAVGGTLMAVGLPKNPIKVDVMDIAVSNYQLKSTNTGNHIGLPKVVEFTGKHGIMPVVDIKPGLESLPEMVEAMRMGKASKRQAVVFS
ncbi:uncharacterized protein E0L32_005925 [Thyridium curvatum]|uniref:Enoyl reductase (ER) domain-containing protein n=1 Tax=Thyridium curvatum TaxID=1093900 RepID=A0A507AUT9_9PEZI|nr:uncharacterized protein E0L32_005925 [Thyridium curvatum]TPX13722.1 hypothetical protein E0L32_005925 [Thyridium curvatum]